jgi:tRNA (cmo5U34)-methyltransferase
MNSSTRYTQSYEGRERAQHWDDRADLVIPRRQELLEMILSVMAVAADRDDLRVVDLGAGTGVLADKILQRWPQASVVCVDKSAEMIEIGSAKFGDDSRVLWLQRDLAAPDWPAGLATPFEVVVSSLTIHLIPDDAKRHLYRWAFEHLVPGGVLVNADRLRAATPALDDVYHELWMQHIVRRTKEVLGKDVALATVRERQRTMDQAAGLKCTTLEQNMDWLRGTGFAGVECYWKNGQWAVFGGQTPGSPDPTGNGVRQAFDPFRTQN